MRGDIICTQVLLIFGDIIKKNEMDMECRKYVRDKKFVQDFSLKTRRKSLLGISRCAWNDKIKMNIKESVCVCVN
jgi:hypothetical protein